MKFKTGAKNESCLQYLWQSLLMKPTHLKHYETKVHFKTSKSHALLEKLMKNI